MEASDVDNLFDQFEASTEFGVDDEFDDDFDDQVLHFEKKHLNYRSHQNVLANLNLTSGREGKGFCDCPHQG